MLRWRGSHESVVMVVKVEGSHESVVVDVKMEGVPRVSSGGC